ncbi:MAG: carbamoyltransferase [bacterium]
MQEEKTKRNAILGISAYYHDSAAALVIDGEIFAASQEERFSRKKYDPSFPIHSIRFVLNESGIELKDLSCVVFYDKPYIKFERLLETYYAFSPKGLKSFLMAIPVWIKEKLFLKNIILKELSKIGSGKPKLLFSEHHFSHAASAFYPSPFEKAAILTIDGVGEWATATIGYGEGNKITIFKELDFPHSIGLLYSAFTYYCGFRVNSGEYKLMGLAPYGDKNSEETKRFRKIITDELVDIKEDGSILLNMKYFEYATGLTMCKDSLWFKLFGIKRREPESELTQPYMNLALAAQQVLEEIVLKLAKTAKAITKCENLVMAGGVALNCVANGKIIQEHLFDDLWIQPAAGDAGGALGAALGIWFLYYNNERKIPLKDQMKGAFLGPEYDENDIKYVINKYQSSCTHFEDFGKLCDEVCRLISEKKVVGWFQGRMEFGPRALGNRSVLADPRSPDMQKRLNLKIKYREGFRPFAPSVLEEDVKEYFKLEKISPYMLLVAPVKEERRNKLPEDFEKRGLYERLYFLRSDIPCVTHLDYSARIQSVSKNTNPRFWQLLNTFKQQSGYGLLVNTSFNVRGEPVVCTPEDAYRCFMRTEMDGLVINNYLFLKNDQPIFIDKGWKKEFALD